ncbi:LuxR C-terminal-related transcriptional regulator [Rhodobacteraceae bacterium KMM 6894]|nr:LuxR C-terminal-related transcriptional regulator [Rhodobacteraceae bacterium KMM 6894]
MPAHDHSTGVSPPATRPDAADFAGFAGHLAVAVAHLGEDGFPRAIDEAIRALVPFDNSMVFAYAPGNPPIGVYTDLPTEAETAIVIDKYILGPYLLDPLYDEVQRGRKGGLAKLSAIAPDEFRKTEYYERHYLRTRITDEIGFFMGLPNDVTAVLSITRRNGSAGFTPDDYARLSDAADLITALGKRHWADLYLRFADADLAAGARGAAPLGPVEEMLRSLQRDTLSDRQAEVIGYLLKGHSNTSISLHLGISAETVKVHRRNAYANLGISSQAELFSIFIDHLSSRIQSRA